MAPVGRRRRRWIHRKLYDVNIYVSFTISTALSSSNNWTHLLGLLSVCLRDCQCHCQWGSPQLWLFTDPFFAVFGVLYTASYDLFIWLKMTSNLVIILVCRKCSFVGVTRFRGCDWQVRINQYRWDEVIKHTLLPVSRYYYPTFSSSSVRPSVPLVLVCIALSPVGRRCQVFGSQPAKLSLTRRLWDIIVFLLTNIDVLLACRSVNSRDCWLPAF